MPILSKRLLMNLQEVLKDGTVSSWYLAQKFSCKKRRLQKVLCNVRSRELIVYKACRMIFFKINFAVTEKGLKYVAKKGVTVC